MRNRLGVGATLICGFSAGEFLLRPVCDSHGEKDARGQYSPESQDDVPG
jgi:hypothetical protein